MSELIWGRHPVREALRAGRALNKIYIQRGSGWLQSSQGYEIINLARQQGVPVQEVDKSYLERICSGGNHQGIAAVVAAAAYVELEEILKRAREEVPFVVAVQNLTDPQNLGSILRTADAAGVHGVIVPVRRSVGLTAGAVKASAGAAAYVPVARVKNLGRTLATLKEEGLWIVGADVGAPNIFWEVDLRGPLVLVIGGEDRGLNRLVRERCDLLVQIPMVGHINSLNAAVAAAILMYEVRRQRREKK